MKNHNHYNIFDGHNDLLLRLWESKANDPIATFLNGTDDGQIDLPKAKMGGLVGGLTAVYVPQSKTPEANGFLPSPDPKHARQVTLEMVELLEKIEARAPEQFQICHSIDDIRAAGEAGRFASVFHIEGAEGIGPELDLLYELHSRGLRSLGPVWSRPNIFATGVPFRFPSSPDIGPGLTVEGRNLVHACNKLGIMVDLAHLNEAGFWDVAEINDAPLVASHSNVHALCAQSRNLTDKQIDAIGESGGLIGVNFGVRFFGPDGTADRSLGLELLVRHMRYIADRIGIEHVALGSDFDGTTTPYALEGAHKLPNLIKEMEKAGFDQQAIELVSHKNWHRVLSASWKH